MKKNLLLILIAATGLSTVAFADNGWDDRYRQHRHHHHDRGQYVVVEQPYYAPAPVVVYQQPQVVYRDRVEYRDRPVYYEAPQTYSQQAPTYRSNNDSQFAGQALGAVTGGVIGSRFGQGNGRLAATAAGAFLGGLVGGRMSSDNY